MPTKASLTKAQRALERKRAADAAFRRALVDARADGYSVRAVAAATGLSIGRVHQLTSA